MTRVPQSCFQEWVEVAWCQEEVETEEEAPQSYQESVPSGLLCAPEKREGVEEREGGGKGGEGKEEREGGEGRDEREGREEEGKGTRVKYKH